jgi:hypothetical protein
MIAPTYNKFSTEYTDVRARPSICLLCAHACWCLFADVKRCCPVHNFVPRGFVQVKFYRVDIDREEIADSVAEACVSTVVRSHAREPTALP